MWVAAKVSFFSIIPVTLVTAFGAAALGVPQGYIWLVILGTELPMVLLSLHLFIKANAADENREYIRIYKKYKQIGPEKNISNKTSEELLEIVKKYIMKMDFC